MDPKLDKVASKGDMAVAAAAAHHQLATSGQHFQMIKLFIKKTKIEVDRGNENDYSVTALNLLIESPSDYGDMEITDILPWDERKRQREANPQAQTKSPIKAKSSKKILKSLTSYQRQKKNEDWFRKKHDTLLIVATLIATVTFTAGLSPPGGIWQEPIEASSPIESPTTKKFMPGTSIMNDYAPRNFKLFMYFDMSGLVSSLFIILFLVSGLPLKNMIATSILVVTIWVAVTSVTMAFVIGTMQIVVSEDISDKLIYLVVGWILVMAILVVRHCFVILFHVFRLFVMITSKMVLWVKKRVGGVRKNENLSGDDLVDDKRDVENGKK